MTNEERRLIDGCRVMIVGACAFITFVKEELGRIGFNNIYDVSETDLTIFCRDNGIVIDHIGHGVSPTADAGDIPVIYGFDFIGGAGAIVVFPGDEKYFLEKQDIRLWAAEYLAGYCAFWNVDEGEWLSDALPAIKEGKTSEEAMKTAAHICAGIAANIAVGREVKRYPQFYLSRNLQ